MNDTRADENAATATSARIIYILYLVSILFGITAIVGLVMAYVNRDDAPEWLKSHYRFQIRTFWIGALYCFLGVLLAQLLIGLFILVFLLFWVIVRCAKGLKYLERKQAYPDPASWLF